MRDPCQINAMLLAFNSVTPCASRKPLSIPRAPHRYRRLTDTEGRREPRAPHRHEGRREPRAPHRHEGRREPRAPQLRNTRESPPRRSEFAKGRASVLNFARTKFRTHRQGRQNQLAVFINIRRISAEVASDDHGRPQHHDEYHGFNPYSCQHTRNQETRREGESKTK